MLQCGLMGVLLGAMLGSLNGCTHRFFKAEGMIGSEGSGALGTWRSMPEGCSRDPVNPPKGVQGQTVATLLWDDMITRDQFVPQHTRNKKSLPARLDLWRTDEGFLGRMETQRPAASMRLDSTVCGTLEVLTREGSPQIQNGRPTLGGTVTLDCRTAGNHLSGHVEFSGCEF